MPHTELKKDIHGSQPSDARNNNNKSILVETSAQRSGFFSNVSTNQTLAGIVKMDSHRLTNKVGDRNLKSSMVIESKDSI